jgi:hypothetical protein
MDNYQLTKRYIGFVEDVNDPLKIGRCRVRVPWLHGEIPTEDIPWANPKHPAFFGQDGLAGSISIPKLESQVEITFNDGNLYSPEYHIIQELEDSVKEQLQKEGEYLGTHIYGFDGDEDLKVYFTKKRGLTLFLKDSYININQDSKITIEHKETASMIVMDGGVITVTSDSEVNTTAGTRIKDTSKEIWLNSSSETRLGKNPLNSAVLGEPLFNLLVAMAGALDTKYPPTPGASLKAVLDAQRLVLSTHVKVTP